MGAIPASLFSVYLLGLVEKSYIFAAAK